MPELPEVEHLRRTLDPLIVGRRVRRVTILRSDIARGPGGQAATRADLLLGAPILATARHGKQLAILSERRSLCVQLGMTGTLLVDAVPEPHTHIHWELDDGRRLSFVDPRRFGGISAFPDAAMMADRWRDALGPDALTISARSLAISLAGRRAPIKALLLNQAILAGVGNIYADEALFLARIAPARESASLDRAEITALARAIRRILREAIDRGGSSIRSYRDANGTRGSQQSHLRVYGRANLACARCREHLSDDRLGQRTTVWCPRCQG